MAKIGKVYTTKENIDVLNTCIKINEPVLLIGETGTGKTTLLNELAKKQKKNLIRVSVNGSTGVEEIIGKWLVDSSTTKWQDGILISAMRNGDWIVFDEINSALPEILFSLHSLLDDDKKVLITEKDNELVRPHKDFRFFGSMNPSDEYAGTKDMNKAFISRFNAIINVEVLNPKQELIAITNQAKIESQYAVELVEIATMLRKKKANSDIFYFCSTRDLIQAGKLIKEGLNSNEAIKVAILNKMSKEEVDLVLNEIVNLKRYVESKKSTFKNLLEELESAKGLQDKYDSLQLDFATIKDVNIKLVADVEKLKRTETELSTTLAKKLIEIAQAK